MRIAIAGGSMAGLFTAVLLRQSGHEVRIFERSRAGLQGRGAGLVPQQEVFDLLDLLGRDEVARLGVVARQRIVLDLEGDVISREDRPQMQVSWDHLFVAVRMQISDDAYRLGNGAVAVGQDEDAAWLDLEDGSRANADLVIGADGIGSAVRRSLMPDHPGASYAGYVAWRALVPERLLPASAARVLSDRFAFYDTPDAHVLGYTVAGEDGSLVKGGRRYNAVWYRTIDYLEDVLRDRTGQVHPYSLAPGSLSPEAIRGIHADARALLPAPFASAFLAEPQPFVQAIFDMTVPRMAVGRVAIIGDAAFVARPHTAMGVAKAAGDAMSLVRAIDAGWTQDARATFERERIAAGEAIVAYGRRLGAEIAARQRRRANA
ncbi:FAD-dependent monooxygenase [Sphingomonas sp. TX0543]|uniref:FAD binding domain-containing protein n=1 Tax=unclassified Sphingomonas TaxID=196159 RepID=UPI0010F4DB67|nr:FAD-dependent monooxygenase [Sphingomonas sp. 3P27F8]